MLWGEAEGMGGVGCHPLCVKQWLATELCHMVMVATRRVGKHVFCKPEWTKIGASVLSCFIVTAGREELN